MCRNVLRSTADPAPDSLSYSARCRQVRALGGDFYGFVPMAHDCLALAEGDAPGKGLAAALMIANVQSSVRTAASFAGSDGPAELDAVDYGIRPAMFIRRIE